ncbi:hypothetical protein PAL_GLEAN10023183 [Pteropus alecto]|uniref:Uncharacterized protein n=1 Tax=Pteropus alecto TaxID=9402 RepID=L5K4L9_PTEAL|nr:hypothetical protein PAL_GLEAN10023183 [Pteropus alecto]
MPVSLARRPVKQTQNSGDKEPPRKRMRMRMRMRARSCITRDDVMGGDFKILTALAVESRCWCFSRSSLIYPVIARFTEFSFGVLSGNWKNGN